MRQHPERLGCQRNRTGMILVVVLVVVMALSFSVYSFSGLMVAEYAATTTGLSHMQRRELATSGIELATLAVRQQKLAMEESRVDLSQPFRLRGHNGTPLSISVFRRLPGLQEAPQTGLQDESAKLNLNALALEPSKRKESRLRLLSLPGMTLQIADAILDWMDPDDEVSEFGAETSWYTAQSPPRRPRQGPLPDLQDLLQVRGVTREMLFGEDLNANGLLDPEENDGDRQHPGDNSDGVLQRGWSEYLTVLSCEGTFVSTGRRRIQLNQPGLATLYDQVEPVLGTEAARWIVAWRMRGAVYQDDIRPDQGEDAERRRMERLESARKRLQSQLGAVDGRASGISADQSQRGGLVLTEGGILFRSLLDLFGGQIQISVNGRDTLLQSPWSPDPATVRRMLPLLEQMLTTTENDVLPGRININEAPGTVLASIPGLNETVIRAIERLQAEIGRTRSDEFQSVGWLAGRGLVSMAELRAIGPYINTGGDVRSGIAVGQTGDDASVAVLQFLIDCSGQQRRILALHDLPVMPATTFLSNRRKPVRQEFKP